MSISLSPFLRKLLISFTFWHFFYTVQAQENSNIKRIPTDSLQAHMNMDATYDRPFLTIDKMPVAVGGYLEANSIFSSENGQSQGLSFQARRLTIFMSSSIGKRIKFLTEIEFEDGGSHIAIEFAAMDISLFPALNVRGGIIMNPIGAFNQNHDGPKWEFVERPDVAVSLLPATWSNAGFGLYGKVYFGSWMFGYEAYLTNGFDDQIIDNEENKTFLPASKSNEARFEESNNGVPLVTGKIAIKNRNIGEVGVSYMGGVYNSFEQGGTQIDTRRRVDVLAIDINTTIRKTGTYIVGEAVLNFVDVPDTYTEQYGNKQWGTFLDIVQPVIKHKILDWQNATFNVALRLDYVDWNLGKFDSTGAEIGDYMIALTPGISLRPSKQTVFRFNYRYQWQTDILNNPPSKSAAWLLGFSTYF